MLIPQKTVFDYDTPRKCTGRSDSRPDQPATGKTPGNPSSGRMLKGHVKESARDIKASWMLEGRLRKAA
jgi:hypothetical protein